MVIALITASEAQNHDKDLPPVYDALVARGVEVEIHNWDDAAVNWKKFAAAIVRSPWDYHRRYEEFAEWLDVVSSQTVLHNAADVVKWNTDKRYLSELADAGIPIIPTQFVRSAKEFTAQLSTDGGVIARMLAGDVVIKPTVSAGSNNTERFHNDYDAAIVFVNNVLQMDKVAMIQPYQKSIDIEHETALLFFNGEFSHAFRKGPILSTGENIKNGLFVVEDIGPRTATDRQLRVGNDVMKFLFTRWGEMPLYARVDLVPGADSAPIVIEVEMAEPSFFFHTAEGSAQRFADAVIARL